MKLDIIKIGMWMLLISVILVGPLILTGLAFTFAGYIHFSMVLSGIAFVIIPLAVIGTLMVLMGGRKYPKVRGHE